MSSTKIVFDGVPQGSVVRPLIFIIFTNDLNKSEKNKALRIRNFKINEYNVNELYKTKTTLKILSYMKLLNCLFVRDIIAQSTIPPFQEIFIQMRGTHQHNTRCAKKAR